MFSSTTMALSTSGPMARASPPSVMALIVLPRGQQGRDRGQHRQRDRQRGDHRRAEVAQEDQDHAGRQQGPEDALLDQALDRLPDVDRLVHDHVQLDALRAPAAFISGSASLTLSTTARLLAPCWR